jgi:CubicO group peptidase (beta-lactamase class C family)
MPTFDERVHRAIEDKVFPGCVIGTLSGGERTVRSFGDTYPIYDLASITKSIPLASLAAIFSAEGKIALTDKVKTYVPELQNDFGATIEDLLRYRVQGVQMSSLRFETFEEIRTHALERGFAAPPGESAYTNLPAFVLDIVIERVAGASLAALAHQHFFEPLGMHDTTFFPAGDLCAPTEVVDGATVQGIPHDESARVFARARRSVGHAGLFSTAGDLLKFAAYLIEHPDAPIVKAAEQGLGWQVNDANFMGAHAHAEMFGKTGFTGTSIIIDVLRKRALVILSNRTYPTRPADGSAINAFRRDIADIFFKSL